MTEPAKTSAHDGELRALRERAYGPSADIHGDPVALARLAELEAESAETQAQVAQAEAEPVVEAEAEPDAARARAEAPEPADDPTGLVGDEASDAPSSTAETPSARQQPSGGRLPRKIAWLWGASVGLALVVGAAIAVAALAWSGERVAVLPEGDLSDWPSLSFGEPTEGARIFDDYLGLTPVIVPDSLGADNYRVPCMFVVVLSDYDGGDPPGTASTTITAGCADGAFTPVASFTVTDAAPTALREALPVGTSVRFTVEGDEAHVTVRRP